MNDGKHVVLCIDDDPDFTDAVRMILEPNGYEVVTAPTAEEGLKAFKASGPDVIIVDLMMEEVDSGTSFVKELQLLGNKAPIYMLSSAGDQLHMATSYQDLGLNGVFQKPIQPQVLLRTLAEKLGQA